ncbi:MAG TPA: flagellar hook-basal body complex protein FliE [Acetobacteraceae bacterium]|nr:flagellar hook-basal body complex protein FliE [Acetobacteraceae bacterium]
MSVPTLTVTPSGAANAYARVQGGLLGSGGDGTSFGSVLTRALEGVTSAGHEADAQSMRAIAGTGNLTEVATAVSRAELALQTAVSIRDRVVQAYQDVMRMPI